MVECSACFDDMSIKIKSAGLASLILASRDEGTFDIRRVAFEGAM